MMVLTRRAKLGEGIVLHDPRTGEVLARITVLALRGNKVKLGVDAPLSVAIDRNEIFDVKESNESNEMAVTAGKD